MINMDKCKKIRDNKCNDLLLINNQNIKCQININNNKNNFH